VLAPSGAGKTTLLKIIAGLDLDYGGRIKYHFDREKFPIGFIFQEESIFPWLTVKENLAFGLKNRLKQRKLLPEGEEEVLTIAGQLGLKDYINYYPNELSGGLKQRVAFGRTLILRPQLILCDEPFSSLDEIARVDMDGFLMAIQKVFNLTILFVTHNINEAIILGDYLLIFNKEINMTLEQLTLSKYVKSKSDMARLYTLSEKIKREFDWGT